MLKYSVGVALIAISCSIQYCFLYETLFFAADIGPDVRMCMSMIILFFGGLMSTLMFLFNTHTELVIYSVFFGLLNGNIIIWNTYT